MKDGDGKSLAYVYFEDEPGRRSAARLMTRDEARRIAVNIAKLTGPAAAILTRLGSAYHSGRACREARGGRGLESKASATSFAC